jgi:hypothetical protein
VTRAERVGRTIQQYQDPRCVIMDTTHETWLLAHRARAEIYRPAWSDGVSMDEANLRAYVWIMGQIDSGASKESYTIDEYIAAGGDQSDYDLIIHAQKQWADVRAKFAKRKAEFDAKQAPAGK